MFETSFGYALGKKMFGRARDSRLRFYEAG